MDTQGIIITVLIALLLGIVIGFYLRQGRINALSDSLKQSREREAQLAEEHDTRLKTATARLQKDYERQLAAKIERYQDQYDAQISQSEQEYQGRVSLMQQGLQAASPSPDADQRLKQQYEARLREAAQKIQQAYEEHLQQKLQEQRQTLEQDYEQRLVKKVEHYESQLESRLQDVTAPVGGVALVSGPLPPTAAPAAADSLRAELSAEYERKLAAKIEHYQDDMARRVNELEQEYEARLRMVQSSPPAGAVPGPATPVPAADPQPDPSPPTAITTDLASEPADLAEIGGYVLDELLATEEGTPPVDTPVQDSLADQLDSLLDAQVGRTPEDDLLDKLDDLTQ